METIKPVGHIEPISVHAWYSLNSAQWNGIICRAKRGKKIWFIKTSKGSDFHKIYRFTHKRCSFTWYREILFYRKTHNYGLFYRFTHRKDPVYMVQTYVIYRFTHFFPLVYRFTQKKRPIYTFTQRYSVGSFSDHWQPLTLCCHDPLISIIYDRWY